MRCFEKRKKRLQCGDKQSLFYVRKLGKEGRASDTMGMKHRIDFGVYKIMGSVNAQLAEKTGFSQEDAEILKEALRTLFENDASSARPEGSIDVSRMY